MELYERSMGYVILFVTVTSLIGHTLAATPTPNQTTSPSTTLTSTAPTLSYTCDTEGRVNLSTVALAKAGYLQLAVYNTSIEEAIGKKSKECRSDLAQITGQVTLSGCTLGSAIYVYVMKESKQSIYGGHEFHEYILKCEIPTNGVHLNASVVISASVVSTIKPVTASIIPIIVPSMTISPNTKIAIGQELTLTISLQNIPKAGNLYILPRNCSAQSGKQPKPTSSYTIPLLTHGKTADKAIMTNFDVSTAGISKAMVYAFRFIDSPVVSIKCFVFICSSVDCEPSLYNNSASSVSSTGGRHRREALMQKKPVKPLGHLVETMFTVKEIHLTKASGQSQVISSILTVLVMTGLLLV